MKWIGILALLMAPSVLAGEISVGSAAEIQRAMKEASPGDVLVMKDGTWKDQKVWFTGKGTAERPITLRAQTPGKVILAGKSCISIEGSHLVLSGVFLDHSGDGEEDGIVVYGDHCRVTDCAVIEGNYKFFVHIFGDEQRVDHCYLAGKKTVQPTLQIEVDAKRPNHNQIDHNHFGPRPPLGQNGGESMRVGYSFQSMFNSDSVVEQNLFDRCDGEIEIISSKSCGNIYRGNTFSDCAGMLTLRHGNRCTIDGNFFIGKHKQGSGGIRVIGEDHVIVNNYIEGVTKGAFWITSGIPNSPLVGYFCSKRCVIAFNTVIDSRGPYLDLSAGLGTSNRTLLPENITIANNLFILPKESALIQGTEGEGFGWKGNLVSSEKPGLARAGMKRASIQMDRGTDGLLHPAAKSAARGGAEGDFPEVKTDIGGQTRKLPTDVGCDQVSDEKVTNHPLAPADLGPTWMGVTQRTSTEARSM